ncbi:NACHT domain-containing protein [Streptomyces sp. ISL-10]|uniref:NACHT domain-containing protein n=1 Tax=Streptomyces sp. ISL-10 TaxID=2819172 RepID=UPI001BE619F0|nr:NACHT domain-containing protein [Streptomyces sp. ISL-10]MBT2369118.1 NACHT domain-containing protein [Streptomyces sp. ISL-10]
MGKGKGQRWIAVAAAALGAAVALGALTLQGGVKVDDKFDVVGAMVGLSSLAVAVYATRQSARALRWQETVLDELTDRLAAVVLDQERGARQKLLGEKDEALDVQFLRCPARDEADGALPEGQLSEVLVYYRHLRPGRLVITGAPGSGKTVLALQLMVRMLDPHSRGAPVPVRMSLASWLIDEEPEDSADADHNPDIADWITSHLVANYGLSEPSARTLVRARRVVPVLDGLDEMVADSRPAYSSRASRAVRALNRYQLSDEKADLVLTCRTETYVALGEGEWSVWVRRAARVDICPVNAATAKDFLLDRADDPHRWEPVTSALEHEPNSALAQALSTPWQLTLASIVYESRNKATGTYLRDPRELVNAPTNLNLGSVEAVRNHLLKSLIPALTARNKPRRGIPYSPDQVHAWLTTLAAYLHHNAVTGRTLGGQSLSGTTMILHQLWPLGGTSFPRVVHTGLISVLWLVSAITMLPEHPLRHSHPALVAADVMVHAVVAGGFLLAARMAWRTVRPEPTRGNLQQLRTSSGRRLAAKAFVLAFTAFLTIGLLAGLLFGVLGGPGPAEGLISGLVPALAAGLCFAFVMGLFSGTLRSVDPRDVVRNDLVLAVPFALVVGLAAGYGVGPAYGLACGVALALNFTMPGQRYVALLLSTRRWNRRWLPWRLGRFLHWCCDAGLLRIADTGYQFRHQEIQDYLAGAGTAQ